MGDPIEDFLAVAKVVSTELVKAYATVAEHHQYGSQTSKILKTAGGPPELVEYSQKLFEGSTDDGRRELEKVTTHYRNADQALRKATGKVATLSGLEKRRARVLDVPRLTAVRDQALEAFTAMVRQISERQSKATARTALEAVLGDQTQEVLETAGLYLEFPKLRPTCRTKTKDQDYER